MNSENNNFDIIIIGGGATGMGCAVEASSRGYKTLLLEAYDFGKGTSSKSTKLIHGGLRYLENLDFWLVKEGLEERFSFLKNAPHLTNKQTYLIPIRTVFEGIKYNIGVKLYELLSGKYKIGKCYNLSKKQTLEQLPKIEDSLLRNSLVYYDGRFDDARILVSLMKTFEANGGLALNYHKVVKIPQKNGKIAGVKVLDTLSNTTKAFQAKHVINATGTFTDQTISLADKEDDYKRVSVAQGTHIVFEKSMFPTEHAILIPKTADGRVLFVLPWYGHLIVGTTDVKKEVPSIEPKASKDEIDFIIETFNTYSRKKAAIDDIKSVYCGQRPLVRPKKVKNSAKTSRKHEIIESANGLISIVGGKWTIFRRMGQDAIDYLESKQIGKKFSKTSDSPLIDAIDTDAVYPLGVYGKYSTEVEKIQQEENNYKPLHAALPYYQAEVIYQARNEKVKTVEDVLARRTRAVFLNIQASIESAPIVAEILATEFQKDENWRQEQIKSFKEFSKNFDVTELYGNR